MALAPKSTASFGGFAVYRGYAGCGHLIADEKLDIK